METQSFRRLCIGFLKPLKNYNDKLKTQVTMNTILTHKQRIKDALLAGMKLSPYMANLIGHTTEGTRIIRELRQSLPIKNEKAEGENFHYYWIDKKDLPQ